MADSETPASASSSHSNPTGADPAIVSAGSWLAALPPVCACLFAHQREQLGAVRAAIDAGIKRLLVQLPTGGGKTHEIAAIVACALGVHLRVLVLATRTRIVRQISERLDAFLVPHGVIAAALPDRIRRASPIQVASVDTLYRRCIVDERVPLPDADVVVFDEAHLALGASRVALLEQYPNAWHLGFTATPAKVSGRGLRDRFDELILGPSVKQLIASGHLVRPRIFTAPVASERELSTVAKDAATGDYAVGDLSALMSKSKLVGDVVSNWLRIANGKRTLLFACNKAHGAALVAEFLQAGVAAELLTDQDAESDREQAIYRLEVGKTRVIVNCFLLSYGTDVPAVECVVLARPTRSVVLYLQSVGRGMRPFPRKDAAIVIDHGRVVESLGMPDDDFQWSLDDGSNVNVAARLATIQRRRTEEHARTCPECSHLWLVSEDGPSCTVCGWLPTPSAKQIPVIDAELQEINGVTDIANLEVITNFYREALGRYAARYPERWSMRQKSGRWAMWMSTKEKFKLTDEKPPATFWTVTPMAPSAATIGWLRSRDIAWAKRRDRQESVT